MNITASHLHQQRSLDTLRMQTEMAIEMLIAILDAIDGDADLEPSLGYHGPGIDEPWNDAEGDPADAPEEDPAESGIADMDGVMEQLPHLFQHCDQRVEA